MNLDFVRRLHAGFSLAIAVKELSPCLTFNESVDLDQKFWAKPKTGDFPNPWHIGTLGSGDYPNPHHLPQSELELLVFMFSMVVQLKPSLVFESGTNVGLMARALGAGCWVNGFGHVVSCDTDERMVTYARKVCEGLPVEVLHSPALELTDLEEADLVFIDSSYESRIQEVKKIKPGAVFVLHDTLADRWLRGNLDSETQVVHLDSPRGFTVVRKS